LETRVLIAVILSLGLIIAYQELVLKRLYPPPERRAAPKELARPSALLTQSQPLPMPQAVGLHPVVPAAQALGREIEGDTDLFRAVFSSRGARLKSFKLKKFRETAAEDSPPYEMVKPAIGGMLPLGFVCRRGDTTVDDAALDYAVDAPGRITLAAGGKASLVFRAQAADGSTLRKTFTFTGGQYTFDMGADHSGGSGAVEAIGLTMAQPLAAHAGYYDVPEIEADVGGKAIVEAEKALTKGVAPVSGPITYAGFGDRYFLSVFMPQSPADGTLAMAFDGSQAEARVLFSGVQRLDALIYMGPKQLDVMEAVNPLLRKSINFGWTGVLALIFLRALKLFHLLAPNYGVDIIFLTLGIRLALLPMSIRSQRSMLRMQRLQPQIQKIREKFADDQERLQREMVDLYKRNHVNPLGGCAPMVLQLPVFIGLYEALLNAVELRHAPFLGWITDLSTPDCLLIPGMPKVPFTHCGGIPVLVLLMGLSTFLQQWMAPQSPDPNQQRMMMLSPIIFTIMLVNFPAGLSLYYFASNVLGIVQQFFLNREFKQLSPATA
jgi:YidC/Oxa1 family membrane protein insertase